MPWHHVIPKHEWRKRFGNLRGVNASDNLVNLSFENHAQLHRRMGEEGSIYDKIAGLMLSAEIGREEGIKLAGLAANLGNKHSCGIKRDNNFKRTLSVRSMGNKYGLGYKHSEDSKRKMREAAAKRRNQGVVDFIG